MPQLTHTIVICLDSVTHNLSVTPEITDVYRGDIVVWRIRTGENIEWIRIGTANHPFTATLPSGNWNDWPVTVRSNAPYGEWKYSVAYKTGQTIASIDPKIAVKPRSIAPLVEISLLVVITVVAALSYFRLQKISRSLKKLQQKTPEI